MAITVSQLRGFVAVAESGSVRAAAARLYVSQPSVSAALSALSQRVGAPLVEREGRGLRLTPAGRAFLPYARDVLGLLEQGRASALEAAGVEGQTLRVAAVTTAGEHVLPALLREFHRRRPDVLVSLEVGNRQVMFERLLARAADVGIGGRPPEGERIVGTPFLDNEHVVVAAADHPGAQGGPVPLTALRDESWLVREPGSGTRVLVERFLAQHGLAPPLHTIGSNGALREAAAAGLGVGIVPLITARDAIAAGTLARLDVDPAPPMRTWHALVLADGARPIAHEFARFLCADAGRA